MKKKKTQQGVDISSTYGMKEGAPRTTWVVVGHRSGAQIFRPEERGLVLVHAFPFPEGKRKGSQRLSDRSGRSFDSWTGAHGGHQTAAPRHALSSRVTPADQAMSVLSETVAGCVEAARKANEFDDLVLVAEPRFLGSLKSHLSESALRRVSLVKKKDFAWLKQPELEARLRPLFAKARPPERFLPPPRGAYSVPRAS